LSATVCCAFTSTGPTCAPTQQDLFTELTVFGGFAFFFFFFFFLLVCYGLLLRFVRWLPAPPYACCLVPVLFLYGYHHIVGFYCTFHPRWFCESCGSACHQRLVVPLRYRLDYTAVPATRLRRSAPVTRVFTLPSDVTRTTGYAWSDISWLVLVLVLLGWSFLPVLVALLSRDGLFY